MEQNDIIEEIVEIPAEDNEEVGNVKISPDVVGTIAGVAASEIDGIAGMSGSFAGGIAEIFASKKNPSKGVKVDIKDGSTVIDLHVVVEYGKRVPELAWELQERVKNDVETMTGLIVQKVNVHVDGVNFDSVKDEKAPEIEDDEDEIIIEETEIEEIPEDGSEEL